jgi:tRNA/tmRNA/rRNA uracil-C5-methylase (TrmA/RlmC/RlmD family)
LRRARIVSPEISRLGMPTAAEAGVLPLADLPRDEQLARLEARVRDALRKGRIDVDVSPLFPSPRATGSRARVTLKSGPGRRLGFFRPGTHDWVEVPLDEIARPEVVAEAARIEGRVSGEVEIRSDGDKVAVVLEHAADVGGNAYAKGRVLSGDPTLRVDGLRVSPMSFYQVNLEVNARIVADVDELLVRLAPARLLDLYAGIGNLSARAVARGVPATLVELDKWSVGDARVNCPGAEIVKGDAGKIAAGKYFFDVALLDPPRAGAPGVIPTLLTTRPRAVLYLSCEPATLARDLRPALQAGYRVTRVQPYDMFPGTEHVEVLAVLER